MRGTRSRRCALRRRRRGGRRRRSRRRRLRPPPRSRTRRRRSWRRSRRASRRRRRRRTTRSSSSARSSSSPSPRSRATTSERDRADRSGVASIYVHFPWCLAKCPYCDFVSYATTREAIDHAGYADAVLREASLRARSDERRRAIDSVFFGGGTPSLWDPAALGRVLAGLHESYAIAPDAEVTVECNPTSLDYDRARALLDAGVNRLSIGTQSLRAEQLKFLGRLHDPAGAQAAVAAAIAAGVPRVSTDLIFGLPEQSVQDARDQAAALADTGLAHLSCYQLTIEPGTQFGERKKRGLLPLADDGAVADAFLAIDEELEGRGLRHYEISNYAAPGQEARHNLAYWRGDEYVGVGCGAYGMIRTAEGGVRWRNAIVPGDYVERTRRGEVEMSREELSREELLRERIMLGLRVAEGVDLGRAGADLGTDPWTPARLRALAKLEERGRVVRDGDVLRIPRPAWLFADDTAARLF
ncbi:MAG: radical SAM family heme chaperone HemW [Labilithrix sp.]|nr:radical SAM family heme chaperone HemW [Labilithrix sp.]MCW5814500.1 radical SAM family heme chaperone HemW [Labilithrix sp.]